MGQHLSLLLLNVSEHGAVHILRHLRMVGYKVTHGHAETSDGLRAALGIRSWDLIIAGYLSPQFDIPSALAILRESGLNIPFIVISDSIGEDKIVALMKAGAHDFINKKQLSLLGPAVKHALQIAAERRGRHETEKALRESELSFRALFENSLDGMMVTVIDGTVLSANARMCEMLDMTENEIIQAGRAGIVVKDKNLAAGLKERIQTGKFQGELRFRRKDGSIIPVELSVINFKDVDGTIKSGQVVRDITDRKRMERELKSHSEGLERKIEERTSQLKKQADLLELAHDAIIVRSIDGKIIYWNSGAEATYGFDKKEAIGKVTYNLLHTEYPVSFEEILEIINLEGRWEGELAHVCKNGKRIIVLSRWALQRSHTGKQPEIMEINRDITERKKSEEMLQKVSTYNRSLIEASLDPLVTIDSDGKITDVNKATEIATGQSRAQLVGTDFSDYFTEPEKARGGYQKVFKEGFVRDYPLQIRNNDDHVMPVLYNASVYKDETGQVIGVFAAARDITERIRAEEELSQKSKALEELNNALKVLFEHHKNDEREFEERVGLNVRDRVIPYIERLKLARLDTEQLALAEIIERNTRDIASPFLHSLSSKYFQFSPKEFEVICLIREGKTTKEIGQLLGIGKRTVDSYRDNIRRKLNISNKKTNLQTCLMSINSA